MQSLGSGKYVLFVNVLDTINNNYVLWVDINEVHNEMRGINFL